jgi:hypothetical protein
MCIQATFCHNSGPSGNQDIDTIQSKISGLKNYLGYQANGPSGWKVQPLMSVNPCHGLSLSTTGTWCCFQCPPWVSCPHRRRRRAWARQCSSSTRAPSTCRRCRAWRHWARSPSPRSTATSSPCSRPPSTTRHTRPTRKDCGKWHALSNNAWRGMKE